MHTILTDKVPLSGGASLYREPPTPQAHTSHPFPKDDKAKGDKLGASWIIKPAERITIRDASTVFTLATSITMQVVYQNGEK